MAIAERVGHESIDITYRYRNTLFPTKQTEMADKLEIETNGKKRKDRMDRNLDSKRSLEKQNGSFPGIRGRSKAVR